MNKRCPDTACPLCNRLPVTDPAWVWHWRPLPVADLAELTAVETVADCAYAGGWDE